MEDNYTKLTKRVAKWMLDACEEQVIEGMKNPILNEDQIKETANNIAYSFARSDHFWNSVCDAITAESGQQTKEVEIQPMKEELPW